MSKPEVEVIDWSGWYVCHVPVEREVDITIDGRSCEAWVSCYEDGISLEHICESHTDAEWDAVSEALEAEHRRLWDTRH